MKYKDKALELVAQMTLEEKASLMSGLNYWFLKGIDRLGIQPIMVTDGPHGLRKQFGNGDMPGISQSVPAVCFPTSAATACSFDRGLMRRIGVALGEECRHEDVAVILGPGVNIKRSPLCGRNFEYFSEDPLLSGEMAVALVQGIQSQNVGVSLKHYAFNNQEKRRMVTDSVIDERAVREIYLPAFENVVKNAQPWTLMCSYNMFEGVYCSESKKLLTDILRNEWGFDGLVMSDWGAVNERAKGIIAGLDLQMPADGGANDEKVVAAVNSGELPMQFLDAAAANVAELVLKAGDRMPLEYDADAHRALAAQAAIESAVLLKNESNVLPMRDGMSFALIGAFAKSPRYQGAGSSKIAPVKLDNAYDCLTSAGATFDYADGYHLDTDIPDDELIAKAVTAAQGKDCVFILAGLPDSYESEGFDRAGMKMPDAHNKLIESVAAVNENIIVFLLGGSPMEIVWEDRVKGIVSCYLGGEAGGRAISELILGNAAPEGRLAESWPFSFDDNPSAAYFPGYKRSVEYRESIFVGYRYYDTAGKAVRYPFGHGLSYTTFEYGAPSVDKESMLDTDVLNVGIDVKNTGLRAGSDVVQLYISHKNPTIFKAAHELKGFEKVHLDPGESSTVRFELGIRDFAYYNTEISDWHVESGEYEICLGASINDIRQRASILIESTKDAHVPDYHMSAPGYYNLADGISHVPDNEFIAILRRPLPARERAADMPFDRNSTYSDICSKWIGRVIVKNIKKQAFKTLENAGDDINTMLDSMFDDMPVRGITSMAGDRLSKGFIDGMLLALNGRLLRGLWMMLRK
ncbi:MAG: glycoside hydrolase family 3 C-terminal domain-containing protein [Oscillospiraceae bacterium]|nr:glycoside hydrolase family 3 C-terminal domain-containing protein [Oscillospiraceae bacterium]